MVMPRKTVPKFRVRVERNTHQFAYIEAEADEECVAEENAQIIAINDRQVKWTVSPTHEVPYVVDDETKEVDSD